VLVYLLLADRDVEIVADAASTAGRRIRMGGSVRAMEAAFREAASRMAPRAGIARINALLEQHFSRGEGTRSTSCRTAR